MVIWPKFEGWAESGGFPGPEGILTYHWGGEGRAGRYKRSRRRFRPPTHYEDRVISSSTAAPDRAVAVAASVREALAGIPITLTLAEVKIVLRRHLFDRWQSCERRTRACPSYTDQSAPTRA